MSEWQDLPSGSINRIISAYAVLYYVPIEAGTDIMWHSLFNTIKTSNGLVINQDDLTQYIGLLRGGSKGTKLLYITSLGFIVKMFNLMGLTNDFNHVRVTEDNKTVNVSPIFGESTNDDNGIILANLCLKLYEEMKDDTTQAIIDNNPGFARNAYFARRFIGCSIAYIVSSCYSLGIIDCRKIDRWIEEKGLSVDSSIEDIRSAYYEGVFDNDIHS